MKAAHESVKAANLAMEYETNLQEARRYYRIVKGL